MVNCQSARPRIAPLKLIQTILVRLADYSLWQSSNEGYSWIQHFPQETFLLFCHRKYTSDRAYSITSGKRFYYVTNTRLHENTFGQPVLHFHPESDYLIWIGEDGCSGRSENCYAEAHYSRDNGRRPVQYHASVGPYQSLEPN